MVTILKWKKGDNGSPIKLAVEIVNQIFYFAKVYLSKNLNCEKWT